MSRFDFDESDPRARVLFVPFRDEPVRFERACQLLRAGAPNASDGHSVAALVAATTGAMHDESNARSLVESLTATVASAVAQLGADGLTELLTALPAMASAVQNDLPLVDESLLRFVRSREHVEQRYPRAAVFAILAAAFFGLWDRRSRLSFLDLFAHAPGIAAEAAKLRCIVHYFFRVAVMPHAERARFAAQHVVVARRHLRAMVPDEIGWAGSLAVLRKSQFTIVRHGSIEEQRGALQCDFANRRIGGGCLSGGNVQEEIRFAISTECIVSLLCQEPMGDEDSIMIRGATQWSSYTGYGHTLQFAGDYVDTAHDVAIACIDANDYRRGGAETQYSAARFVREIQKVFTAVHNVGIADFATGNLGCGVFLGDASHKSLLQWIACTVAGVNVLYLPFNARGVADDLEVISTAVDGKTVGEVFDLLTEYGEHVAKSSDARQLFVEFVQDRCNQ
jgi:hypothetical protein